MLEEWDEDACLVRFAFDRLFEFMLAQHLDPYIDEPKDVLQLAERGLQFKNVKGALEMILLRACRDGRFHLVIDSLDLCDGESPVPAAKIILEVIQNLLESLGRSRDDSFVKVLELLPEDPGQTDLQLLLNLCDRFLLLGELQVADQTIDCLLYTSPSPRDS